jgi:hypothetical protein
METSAPQVFAGITRAQYEILVEKIKAAGFDVTGDSGTATKYGVEIAWNYSPATLELSFQCLHVPMFMTVASIDARIQALVHEALA